MAAEYSESLSQNVASNGSLIFSESPVPCNCGFIYHRDGSGIFRLANRFVRQNFLQGCKKNSNYLVGFQANIAIPAGGTVEPISLAMVIDGEVDLSSVMTVTPAAVGDYWNVNTQVIVQVPWICSCGNISVRNISNQTVTVQNANIVFETK